MKLIFSKTCKNSKEQIRPSPLLRTQKEVDVTILLRRKEINMGSHGGMREGSGRPVGAANKATSELKLNLSELAREYTNDA